MMRQISIVLKINTPTACNYSTLFHIYEIGLFLADSGFDVIYWVDSDVEREMDWDLKYMQILPVVFDEEQLPKSYVLITDSCNFLIDNVDKIKKIFFINNPMMECSLTSWQNFKYIKHKSYLLYSEQLNQSYLSTDVGYSFFEDNRIYQYDYGIYNKYLLNTHKTKPKWLLANDTATDDINNSLCEYIKDNNIMYEISSNTVSLHNTYISLLYANNVDFFTRLPFEFALANKKVVMFDCDPSFRKLTKHQLWNYPYIIEDIPILNLDLNMFKNN